jgi:shikimate kinase/3-dehydroquinate synthase
MSTPIQLLDTTPLPRTGARNLVLTGFMGTGKSSVGAEVAARMERDFLDMDALLEAEFGKPVSAIFAEEGEEVFRAAEAQLAQRLGEASNLVIATGGGALVNPHNRAALAQHGVIVCLTATVDEILARLGEASGRPLLAGDDEARRTRVRDLLHQRRHAYAAIAHQVDTTNRTLGEVAALVVEAFAADEEAPGMTRIPVHNPDGVYDLLIGEGLLSHAGRLLAARGVQVGVVAVVSNPNIFAAQGERLLASLRTAGFAPIVHLVPEGEEHKTFATVGEMYGAFAAAGMDRKCAIIALGGGVVGDMAGFAAATWLRGVPFVQCPTSLLSMVDASVGGKTGVDLPQGKNLVGAFKQPAAVIMDTQVLETLPAAEYRSGLGEVIKHGVIGAPELFAQLETYGPTSMKHLVTNSVRVKVRLVEEDPFEKGNRAWLNLGHTFGHAIEQASEYGLRHGECVAIGMVAAAQMSLAVGLCSAETAARIEQLVTHLGLPARVPADIAQGMSVAIIRAFMGQDKKRAAGKIRFVLPRAIGDVVTVDSPGEEYVTAAIEYVLHKP